MSRNSKPAADDQTDPSDAEPPGMPGLPGVSSLRARIGRLGSHLGSAFGYLGSAAASVRRGFGRLGSAFGHLGSRLGSAAASSRLSSALARFPAALIAHKPIAVVAAAVAIVAILGAGVVVGGVLPTPRSSVASVTQEPAPVIPTETPWPNLLAIPTAGPTATPYPAAVAATTDGVLLPWYDADLATRRPIAVMLDDHWAARPQAGLSQADVVYQALAEGGIPRYMAIFQTQDPPSIGGIRSARLYFLAWAEEWQAMYVHVAGAPNAMARVYADNKVREWNADGLRYLSTHYMWRVDFRVAPHNAWTSGRELRALLAKLGGASPGPPAFWTFTDEAPLADRPEGGTIDIPYRYNDIQYKYDRATNTYLRWVTSDVIRHKESPDLDYNNGVQVAPKNVVVMYMDTYALAQTHHDLVKHRLDLRYVGSGKATVFQNGHAIAATWVKSKESSATTFRYASGPQKGQQIPFVRGQIFIQVIPTGTAFTYTLGRTVAPQY
jgi:hypothetical protein